MSRVGAVLRGQQNWLRESQARRYIDGVPPPQTVAAPPPMVYRPPQTLGADTVTTPWYQTQNGRIGIGVAAAVAAAVVIYAATRR